MTSEEVVELANGTSQVVQQRGLRDAFAPASLFNRHDTRHCAASRLCQRHRSAHLSKWAAPEIAAEFSQSLKRNFNVPGACVRVTVKDEWLTFEGKVA
jgi:hypothetical protein